MRSVRPWQPEDVLYGLIDWQRGQWDALLELTQQASSLAPVPSLVTCHAELLRRTLGAVDRSDLCLEEAVLRDAGAPVGITVLDKPSPFTRLIRFNRGAGPQALFIAPYSGYATAVSSALVAALGNVTVTDWQDARDVPLDDGRFDLDDQIRLVARLVESADRPTVIVGLSQSGPALLAGAALAMLHGCPAPKGIILLGAPIDMRNAAGAVQQMLEALPPGTIESNFASTVPARYPGAGRKVYPGFFQLMAYALSNPAGYLEAQTGLWGELLAGVPGPYERMHGDLHGLIDVPFELYHDMIRRVLRRSELARSDLRVDDHKIDLTALRSVPMLTIEARQDALIGPGQTHATHGLLNPDGSDQGRKIDVDGGHDALFHGTGFGLQVAPALRKFLASLPDA